MGIASEFERASSEHATEYSNKANKKSKLDSRPTIWWKNEMSGGGGVCIVNGSITNTNATNRSCTTTSTNNIQ